MGRIATDVPEPAVDSQMIPTKQAGTSRSRPLAATEKVCSEDKLFAVLPCSAVPARSAGRPLGESGIAEPLVGQRELSADELVTLVRRTFRTHAKPPDDDDRTVLVIKRTKGLSKA